MALRQNHKGFGGTTLAMAGLELGGETLFV